MRWLPVAAARLGDADVHAWWRSHGMDGTGEYVLSDLFPRTWMAAGAELSMLSAAKRHLDTLPARADVIHLFGEPFPAFRQAMAWLAELKTGGDVTELEALRQWSKASAASEMRAIVGAPTSGERIAGTLRLGSVSHEVLTDPKVMARTARSLAAAYVDQTSELHIPYFDLV